GRLYIGTEGGSVIAYNLDRLTKDWEYRVADEGYAKNVNTDTNGHISFTCDKRFADNQPVRSSPTVYAGRVYFGSDVHVVFAINEGGLGGLLAGKTDSFWKDTSQQGCPPPGTSTVTSLPQAALTPAFSDVVRASPVIDAANGLVIVASYDSSVRAFSANDGTLRWNFTAGVEDANARVVATPAVLDGKVYFGTFNGSLYALDTSNSSFSYNVNAKWRLPVGAAIWSSPVVSNGLVVFGADDGQVYAVNTTSGEVQWSVRTGGSIRAPPALWTGTIAGSSVEGGVVYVAGTDGILYAYGGEKPPLADLRVTGIDFPRDPFLIDSTIRVSVDVENAGNESAPATDVQLFVDTNLAGTKPVEALDPAAVATVAFDWRIPAGNHSLRAVVDPNGLSREYDRGNNEARAETPIASQRGGTPGQPSSPGGTPAPSPEPRAAVPGLGALGAMLAVLAALGAARSRRP
ncbi:MAG TPA: PQQ-binding-like beta-propeller repeat protein, partial [Chloroflexota bacterium]|nr:PQQ-binding-like beta-propeller repeat protein [Chloroflexota bacterium]